MASWEVTSEVEVSRQEVPEGPPQSHTSSTGSSRTGWRDRPGCDAVLEETRADPEGSFKDGEPPREIRSRGEGASCWQTFMENSWRWGSGVRLGPRQPS